MKLTFTIISFFVSLNAMAQFSIGFQGGGNSSTMDFTNNEELRFTEIGSTQGFTGGLVLNFLGDKHAGVQFEINYAQRGWILNDTIAGNNLQEKNQMDYFEIPLLTHVNIGGGKFRGIFHIGPYVGYALNRTITVTDLNTGREETINYQFVSARDNQFDFGLIVGGGFEYRLPLGKIAVEARYTFGFGDIDKVKDRQSEVSQFRVITGLLRYTVPLTRKKEED